MKKNLDVKDILILVDTREQRPFELKPFATQRATLKTGDYSVKGFEDKISIERKSLPDLIACIGRERDRFERELVRLLEFKHRAVIVEAPWSALHHQTWRGLITPRQARGSVSAWGLMGVYFHFAGSRELADDDAANMLFIAARREHRKWVEQKDSLLKTPQ